MMRLAGVSNLTCSHLGSQGKTTFSSIYNISKLLTQNFFIINLRLSYILVNQLGSFQAYKHNAIRTMKKQQNSSSKQHEDSEAFSPQLVIPLSKMPSQLINKLRTEKIPSLVLPEFLSVGERANRYYDEYQRLFQENNSLNEKLAEVIEERNRLAEKFNTIKRTKSTEEAVKRKRRYARDIQRLFHCPIEKCNRGYGSEGSLSHHVRLKHLDFYTSGKYELFIQKYIDEMQKKKKGEEENIQESLPQKNGRPAKEAKLNLKNTLAK